MDSEIEDYEYVAEIEVKEQVHALASSRHPNKVFDTLLFNGNQEKFRLDSISLENIITDETVLMLCGQSGLTELEEAPVTLVMYNQAEEGQTLWQEAIESRQPEEQQEM